MANSFRKVEKVVAHGSGQSGLRTHTFTFPIFWCRRTIQPQGYVQYIEIIKRYFTQSGLSFTWKSQSQPPRQVKTLKAGYAPGEYEMLCRNKMITNHGHFDNFPFILFKMQRDHSECLDCPPCAQTCSRICPDFPIRIRLLAHALTDHTY